MKAISIALLASFGIASGANAYQPATLVNCDIQVSPQRGTYYVGIYRLGNGEYFRLGPFRNYCPTMIDADQYLY